MTIEEKAKEYVVKQVVPKIGITMPISPLIEANVRMETEDAFSAGAKWMLEKACEYLMNQLPIQYPEWKELAEENVRQFKKAMEE